MTQHPDTDASSPERELLADASFHDGWRLIQRFATLNRESGSPDEHAAADWIAAELHRIGVEYEMFEPSLYLSLPREASVVSPGLQPLRGKPPAFAAPSPPQGVTAEAVYLPAPPLADIGELFEARQEGDDATVAGRIVVTDGYAMPASVQRFERAGAVAQVYVNPGRNIHWGICTPIWGTPTHENLAQKPRTSVVAISRPDGEQLVARLREGVERVTVHASLEEGWYRCKLPVATIRGQSTDFVLAHGHYDSWDVGIGDNAVGDATLLELARIFHGAGRLRRSLKVAWWPGHSMGRYAGSTWYADQFASELDRHCVAAMNIDSPGCREATAYEDVMWMSEADGLCRVAIADATGAEAARRRPIRAGDWSFNQLGLTSFFMLLSNIPQARREELGYYPVGGCGGNVAWHTEDDGLDVADRTSLERDLRVYVTALARVLDADVLPFDYRETVRELAGALSDYRRRAEGLLDLQPVVDELDALRSALASFYERIARAKGRDTASVNETLKRLARVLVPLGYARGPRFQHDPALSLTTLPRLDAIAQLEPCARLVPDRLGFLQAGLRRQVNAVAGALREATRLASGG